MDVFTCKRREPRVRLRTRVQIVGRTADDVAFSLETLTLDVSPHGASVEVDRPLPIGTRVEFIASKYPFRASATVRSVTHDSKSGTTILGLEYPDEARNPLVIWSAVEPGDEIKTANSPRREK